MSLKSDLVNSYAWDTAIVYIQEMTNTNYSEPIPDSERIELATTDEKCKIFDMANISEWTTEYSLFVECGYVSACVSRQAGERAHVRAASNSYFRFLFYIM